MLMEVFSFVLNFEDVHWRRRQVRNRCPPSFENAATKSERRRRPPPRRLSGGLIVVGGGRRGGGGGGGEWGDAREQCPARKCVSKAPCDWWISGDSTEPSVINTRASAAAAATAAVGRALSACPIEAMAFLCSCHFRKPSSRLMAREKLSSPTHSCLSFMALFTTLLSLPTEISSSH